MKVNNIEAKQFVKSSCSCPSWPALTWRQGSTIHQNVANHKPNNEAYRICSNTAMVASDFAYLLLGCIKSVTLTHLTNRLMDYGQRQNITYFAAISLFRSRLLSRGTKIILYKALIRPVVSYGAEAWTLTKKEEQAVLIFERKIFRRICGPKYENGEWKSRTNRELEEMSKGENIVKWIKGQSVRWLGHLERMEEDRMPKKIFTQELEGTRRRGRPRKRWKEEVERDLQVMEVRRWRELVADRKKWKDIVRQAKAHSGL